MLNNPYIPECELFKGSAEFSYLAEFFNTNKCYTFYKEETYEYNVFWEKVFILCCLGFTNSYGISITGEHFFYLNFVKIKRAVSKEDGQIKKEKAFPLFFDIDYEYFWMVDYCKKNQKSLILVKPRRRGYSYKTASIITCEYSICVNTSYLIGGYLAKYSEGTMKMVLDNLNFLDSHTGFKQQRSPNLKDYIKSRYISTNSEGASIWKGNMNEVKCVTFMDNPYAAVGDSSDIIVFEEAGVFDNIIESYGYSEFLIKDGGNYTGIALVYGSAGSMEGGTISFYEMFTNPSKYNMLEFDDPFRAGEKVGCFVSSAMARAGKYKGEFMMDEDGNSNTILATKDILEKRKEKKGGTDYHAYHLAITQDPLDYKEAFLRSKSNIFPVIELAEHLGKIETTKKLRDLALPIELYFEQDNKIAYRVNPELEPIMDYPLKPEANKTGCPVIWEPPYKAANGEIPFGLYLCGQDPYDQDKSSTNSLGSFFVYKTFLNAGETYSQIVAEYTGRPTLAKDFYENCRRLMLLYNARCLYENQLTGFKGYLDEKNTLYLLAETPTYQLSKMSPNSSVRRGYGIHMTDDIKDQLEIYTKEWLLQERTGHNGEKMLNLHTINSIPLLKELINYDRGGNFDRCIAFFCCILLLKENHNIHVESTSNSFQQDPFWSRKLFQGKPQTNYR